MESLSFQLNFVYRHIRLFVTACTSFSRSAVGAMTA
jgi:hypothetical protein